MTYQIDKERIQRDITATLAMIGSYEQALKISYSMYAPVYQRASEQEGQAMLEALQANQLDIAKIMAASQAKSEDILGRAIALSAREQNKDPGLYAAECAYEAQCAGCDLFLPGVEVPAPPDMSQISSGAAIKSWLSELDSDDVDSAMDLINGLTDEEISAAAQDLGELMKSVAADEQACKEFMGYTADNPDQTNQDKNEG